MFLKLSAEGTSSLHNPLQCCGSEAGSQGGGGRRADSLPPPSHSLSQFFFYCPFPYLLSVWGPLGIPLLWHFKSQAGVLETGQTHACHTYLGLLHITLRPLAMFSYICDWHVTFDFCPPHVDEAASAFTPPPPPRPILCFNSAHSPKVRQAPACMVSLKHICVMLTWFHWCCVLPPKHSRKDSSPSQHLPFLPGTQIGCA